MADETAARPSVLDACTCAHDGVPRDETTAGAGLTPAARFGQRVAVERSRRGWSMRALCANAGLPVAPSVIHRVEHGGEVTLSVAVKIATTLGLSLDALIEAVACEKCGDAPPPGFRCNECGASR